MKSGWFSTRVFAFILFASKNNILFFPSNKRKTTPNERIGDRRVETLKRDKPAPKHSCLMIAAISHTKKINDDYLNHCGLTLVSSDQNHRMSFGLKQVKNDQPMKKRNTKTCY